MREQIKQKLQSSTDSISLSHSATLFLVHSSVPALPERSALATACSDEMPPRPPIPHLPPLPPPSTWSTHFPRRLLAHSDIEPAKFLRGRTILAKRELCDAFARELKIRPGEIIIDVNPGVGALTRSLLEGGNEVDEGEVWDAWRAAGSNSTKGFPSWDRTDGVAKGAAKGKAKGGKVAKGVEGKAAVTALEGAPSTLAEQYPRPALVIAVEPSIELLRRSFDYTVEDQPVGAQTGESLANDPSSPSSSLDRRWHLTVYGQPHLSPPSNVIKSPHHPNLILSEASAYRWAVLPALLSHPLIAPHITMHQDGTEPVSSVEKEWSEEEPNVTVVATIPDSVFGEQLLAQWIGTAAGGSQGKQWIWRWGRVRLALLCGKGLYDVGGPHAASRQPNTETYSALWLVRGKRSIASSRL
jgi:hypothetical protein